MGMAEGAPAKSTGWRRTGKADIVLKLLARQVVSAECERRGTSVSPTINSLITEWHLLSRIRNAEDLRRAVREAIVRMQLGARNAAAAGGITSRRDEALAEVDRAAEEMARWMMLITSL